MVEAMLILLRGRMSPLPLLLWLRVLGTGATLPMMPRRVFRGKEPGTNLARVALVMHISHVALELCDGAITDVAVGADAVFFGHVFFERGLRAEGGRAVAAELPNAVLGRLVALEAVLVGEAGVAIVASYAASVVGLVVGPALPLAFTCSEKAVDGLT